MPKMKKTAAQQPKSQEVDPVLEGDSEQCPVFADDGVQCTRSPHLDNPNGHIFSATPIRSVDGGKRWSDWIKQVHSMKSALIGHEYNLSTSDGQKLAQLAEVLELFTIPSDIKGKGIVADSPDDNWKTYKEVPE